MGPRAGLDGRKISSPPGFDLGPSSPSVGIPTELPGPFCVSITQFVLSKCRSLRWITHGRQVREWGHTVAVVTTFSSPTFVGV